MEQKLEERTWEGHHDLAQECAQKMTDQVELEELGELAEELLEELLGVGSAASKRSEVIAVTFQETNHFVPKTVEPAALP